MSSSANDAPTEDAQWLAIESPSFRFGSAPSSVIGPPPASLFPNTSIIPSECTDSNSLEPTTANPMELSPPEVESEFPPGTASLPNSEVGFTQLVDALCEDSSQRSQQEPNRQHLTQSLSSSSLPAHDTLHRDNTTILDVPPLRSTSQTPSESRTDILPQKSFFSVPSWKLPSPGASSASSSMNSSDDEGDFDEQPPIEAKAAENGPNISSPFPEAQPVLNSPLPSSNDAMDIDIPESSHIDPSPLDIPQEATNTENHEIEAPVVERPPSPSKPLQSVQNAMVVDTDPSKAKIDERDQSDEEDSEENSGWSDSSEGSGVRKTAREEEEAEEEEERMREQEREKSRNVAILASMDGNPKTSQSSMPGLEFSSSYSSDDDMEGEKLEENAKLLESSQSVVEVIGSSSLDHNQVISEVSDQIMAIDSSKKGVVTPKSKLLETSPISKPSRSSSQLTKSPVISEERKLHSFKPIRSDGTGLPLIQNTSPLQKFELPPIKPSQFPLIQIPDEEEEPVPVAKKARAKATKAKIEWDSDSDSAPTDSRLDYDATFVPSTLSFGSTSSKLDGPGKRISRRRRDGNHVSIGKLIDAKLLLVGDFLEFRGLRALVKHFGWLEADAKTSLPEVSDWTRWVLQRLDIYDPKEDTSDEYQYWGEVHVIHTQPATQAEIVQYPGSDTLDRYADRWQQGITDDIPKEPLPQRKIIERPSAPAKQTAPKKTAKRASAVSSPPISPRSSNEMDIDTHTHHSGLSSQPLLPMPKATTAQEVKSTASIVSDADTPPKTDRPSRKRGRFNFASLIESDSDDDDDDDFSVLPMAKRPKIAASTMKDEPLYVSKRVAKPAAAPALVEVKSSKKTSSSAPIAPVSPKEHPPAPEIITAKASAPKAGAKKGSKASAATKTTLLPVVVPPPVVEPKPIEPPPVVAKATKSVAKRGSKATAAAKAQVAPSSPVSIEEAPLVTPSAPKVAPKTSPVPSKATKAKVTKATAAASVDDGSGPVIVASGLSAIMSKSLALVIGKLGGRLSQSMDDQVTHLVANVDETGLASRTFKYLEAILRGVDIVATDWVVQSLSAGKYLPSKKFLVSGDSCFEGGPAKAVAGKRAATKQRNNLIFRDKTIFLNGDFSSQNQLKVAQLQQLLRLGGCDPVHVGGKTRIDPAATIGNNQSAIVVCDEATDQDIALVLCLQTSASPISPLWILDSISHCECVDIETYLIVDKPTEEEELDNSQSW